MSNIQVITLLFMLSTPVLGFAASEATYYLDAKQVSKRDALIALLNNPQANVVKCTPQEVSDKATLRNKK